jgi:dipeptidyl aminopeptidase/acylaminoacyl peptidase
MNRSAAAFAASALLTLSAANAAAQGLSAGDFTRRPQAWETVMSPSGDYVAMAVPIEDGMETRLEIIEIATGKRQVLRFGRQQHVSDIVWTADDQIVVSRAETQPLKARPVTAGELYTTDVHGKNQDVLFGFIPERNLIRGRRNDQGWSEVVAVPQGEPGIAMVEFTCWNCGKTPDTVIYKVDTRTGERREIERAPQGTHYAFDQAGEARIRTSLDDDDQPMVLYRRRKGDAWAPMPKAIAGRQIDRVRFAPDGNTVYALVTDGTEPARAFRIDLEAGTRTLLASDPDIAVAGFMFEGFGGIPFAVTYDAYKPTLEYVDPDSEWAKLHASLMRNFPGQFVSFGSFSRDGRKVLFSVWSDRNIGTYYVLDRQAGKAQKVVDYKPWLKMEDMSPTRAIEFTGRSGQKLFGFYTAKGSGPKPLVVMAHGGPFGVHDTWGFDYQVQFLASRGYGVLQVNYRGSDGRGEGFMQSGWKGWGTTIQEDVTDGVRWAIAQNLADPQRICTFGASFGGYTALIQPILEPGMYKCAIGYAGVYDLPLMRRTESREGMTRRTSRWLDRTLGTDLDALARVSPAQRVADLKVPVMLVHGTIDHTADFNQFTAMDAALRKAGRPAETFVAKGEGHGFVKPETEAELYRRVAAFLDKYIGPDAQ